MTRNQLDELVKPQIEFNIQQLSENLTARGSEIESILRDRDQFEIGTFPQALVFDFNVFQKVTVIIHKISFAIQTTYYMDDLTNPTVEKGLWFPLTVNDPGPGKTCTVSRITYKDDGGKFIPVVDMVFGEPPRVVAANIVQVMDPASTPETAPPPLPPPKEKKAEKPKAEASRRNSYHPRRRDQDEDAQKRAPAEAAAPPPRRNACTGDISLWASAGCKIGITK